MKVLLIFCVATVVCVESRGGYWEWRPAATSTTTESPPIVSWRTGQRYFTKDRGVKSWRAGEYQKSGSSSHASWRSSGTENSIDTSNTGIKFWEPLCDFPQTMCGMESQAGLGSEFEPAYTFVGSAYEKVMIVDASRAQSSAARLITPYIKTRNREEVCLSLQYLIQGDGVDAVTVIQQDRQETRTVYTVNSAEKKGMWRLAKMDLVMRQGMNRFFVEVRLSSGRSGMFMVRDLHYEAGRCMHENASLIRRSRLMDKYWQLSGH